MSVATSQPQFPSAIGPRAGAPRRRAISGSRSSVIRRCAALAVALFSTGCDEGESAPAAGRGGPGGGMPPMPVEVAVARRDTVVEAINATGQIEAVQSIELRPDVEGRLAAILVDEGRVVDRGTPLFKIDDAELKTQVARAEAERDLARQALARTKELAATGAATTSELERTDAAARSSQAQLDLLELRLDRSTVRAPFTGIVGRRLVSLGDYVNTQSPLISLQTFDPQRAVFQISERHAERIAPGQRIVFRVASLPDREFNGVVDFVDPVVQLPARTITVKARVANARRALQPGMFIEVRLATAVRPAATLIPEDAVLTAQGSRIVWVVRDDKATRREVALGVRMPGFVEILSGVEPGEQVVVGGAERLQEGAPVAPTVIERGVAQRANSARG